MTAHPASNAPRTDRADAPGGGLCATCHAPAVVILVARGTGPITYRAALACQQHRGETRRWVARVGPAVTETPLETTAEDAGLLW